MSKIRRILDLLFEESRLPDGFDGFDFDVDSTDHRSENEKIFDSLKGKDEVKIGDLEMIVNPIEKTDRNNITVYTNKIPKDLKSNVRLYPSMSAHLKKYRALTKVGKPTEYTGNYTEVSVLVILDKNTKEFYVYETKNGDPVGKPLVKSKDIKKL